MEYGPYDDEFEEPEPTDKEYLNDTFPLPWSVQGNPYYSDAGEILAVNGIVVMGAKYDLHKAVAREIAWRVNAAPDLLEVCEMAKARWERIGIDRLNETGLAEYTALCAAIAKAEGRE